MATGMNAYEAILEALIARGRSGEGAAISVSLFDAMADWMTVPLLHYEGGKPPQRVGLAHPSISPYGVFKSRDGVDILISIQNDREWRLLAGKVMGDDALAADPDFATNVERVKRRAETDGRVQASFASMDLAELERKLAAADIAFAPVNDTASFAKHPHLRRISFGSAERAGFDAGAGAAARRRRAQSTARSRRSASTPRPSERNFSRPGVDQSRAAVAAERVDRNGRRHRDKDGDRRISEISGPVRALPDRKAEQERHREEKKDDIA